MKPMFTPLVVAIALALASHPCYASWGIETVSKARAKEVGMEVRSEVAGSNLVRVELEFKVEGELKNFSEVELRFGSGDGLTMTALLREDRSKPGRVVVVFTASPAQLDRFTLWVRVPSVPGTTLGGAVYELRVRDFVGPKTG